MKNGNELWVSSTIEHGGIYFWTNMPRIEMNVFSISEEEMQSDPVYLLGIIFWIQQVLLPSKRVHTMADSKHVLKILPSKINGT